MMKYTCSIPRINIIDCKVERCTSAFPFALEKAFTLDNMSVFKGLVVWQMSLDWEDCCWSDHLTIG